MEIKITDRISISDSDIEITFTRSGGKGGQNVNKVSTAVHLKFDIEASSLPGYMKGRVKRLSDSRITKDEVVVIKAQQHRTQELNREDAIQKLVELIKRVTIVQKHRVATKPTKASKKRRVENKKKHSDKKAMRRKGFD